VQLDDFKETEQLQKER